MRGAILLTLVLFFLSSAALAQPTDTTHQNRFAPEGYNRYMKQRKTFNTLGWVALGAGVVMCVTSYLDYAGNDFNGTWELEPLFIAGLVTTGISIPLFITASIFKRKARLALVKDKAGLGKPFGRPGYPAIALQLKF